MYWCEFLVLVKCMLCEQCGLCELIDLVEEVCELSSDFMFSDGFNYWLVLCKYGLVYCIGIVVVNELGVVVCLVGVKGGVLLIEGCIECDGCSVVEKQVVEVFDGLCLWLLLQFYLFGDIEVCVCVSVWYEVLCCIVIVVLGLVMLGLLVGLGLQGLCVDEVVLVVVVLVVVMFLFVFVVEFVGIVVVFLVVFVFVFVVVLVVDVCSNFNLDVVMLECF